MAARTPKDVPLEEWPVAWLRLEVAVILDPLYLTMSDHEKQGRGYPVTEEEMRAVILDKRNG